MTFGENKIQNTSDFVKVFLAVERENNEVAFFPLNYMDVIDNIIKNDKESKGIPSYRLDIRSLDKTENGQVDYDQFIYELNSILSKEKAKAYFDINSDSILISMPEKYVEKTYKDYGWQTVMQMKEFANEFDNQSILINTNYNNKIKQLTK